MSIAADSAALQARLVQQLASLRQQELNNLCDRYVTIGVTASLVGGFSIQVLIAGSGTTSSCPSYQLVTAFYLASYGCVLAAVHTVIVTTFCSSRAPLVALRGKHGAVTIALEAVRRQQTHIDMSLLATLIAFVLQTLGYMWINESVAASMDYDAKLVSAFIVGAGFYSRMHTRGMIASFEVADQTHPGVVSAAPSGGALASAYVAPAASSATEDTNETPLLDAYLRNPLYAVEREPDLASSAEATAAPPLAKPALAELHGPLHKHVESRGLGLTAAAAAVVAAEWRERYFVLSERWLLYWGSGAELTAALGGSRLDDPIGQQLLAACAHDGAHDGASRRVGQAIGHALHLPVGQAPRSASLEPSDRLDLHGYQVVIDLYDPHLAITLQPADPAQRTWRLRAPTEEARAQWTAKLVAATRWASSQPPLQIAAKR